MAWLREGGDGVWVGGWLELGTRWCEGGTYGQTAPACPVVGARSRQRFVLRRLRVDALALMRFYGDSKLLSSSVVRGTLTASGRY